MARIAETLEFMTGWVVRVCEKAGVGRKAGHQKPCYYRNFYKITSKIEILGSSR
jgi:hypothetical protein